MLSWEAVSADYAAYHTTPGNRACHMAGIPLIVLALERLTQFGPLSPIPLITVFWPVYLFWDRRLAAAMAAALALLAVVAAFLPLWAGLAAFAAGWFLQFIGHAVFEKKRAAFQDNLLHLLVGPAWVLAKALGPRRP